MTYRHRFTYFTDALIPIYNWGFEALAGRKHEKKVFYRVAIKQTCPI